MSQILKLLGKECPEGYKVPENINISSISENEITLKGIFLLDMEVEDAMDSIKQHEKGEDFKITINNEDIINKIIEKKQETDFTKEKDLSYKTEEDLWIYKDKLAIGINFWIDISNLDFIEYIRDNVIKDKDYITEDSLIGIKITSFLNYDWVVDFHTKEPHKFYKGQESLEDYAEMVEENNDTITKQEVLNKNIYSRHHHDSPGIDDEVKEFINKFISKTDSEETNFNEISIDHEDKDYLHLTSYEIYELP